MKDLAAIERSLRKLLRYLGQPTNGSTWDDIHRDDVLDLSLKVRIGDLHEAYAALGEPVADMDASEALHANCINQIRGRNSVNAATREDVGDLLGHIDALEELLDEGDGEDAFGTEGWRRRLGID